MIDCAGAVEGDHTADKYRHSDKSGVVGVGGGFHHKRRRSYNSHHHGDEVGDGASGFANRDLHKDSFFLKIMIVLHNVVLETISYILEYYYL